MDLSALMLPGSPFFKEALPVLTCLQRYGVRMLIFSNATRPFIDAEIKRIGIEDFFEAIISLPDDWGIVKAEPSTYTRLMNVHSEITYIGDHNHNDYEVPRSLGIAAFHV